jgi:hypothetical protein
VKRGGRGFLAGTFIVLFLAHSAAVTTAQGATTTAKKSTTTAKKLAATTKKSAAAAKDSTAIAQDSTATAMASADSSKSTQDEIRDLQQQVEELTRQLDETKQLSLSTHNRMQVLENRAPDDSVSLAIAARLAELERQMARDPEAAEGKVSLADFPNAIPIPGTDAAIRIGGQARFNVAHNFAALGSEGRFVTSTIPIAGTEAAGKGPRTTLTASGSRFSFDFRSPSSVGYLRTFLEGDFRGSGNTLRLRHAFAQWEALLFGQTWSTFSDPDAQPDGIDLEGLNAISLFRQGQVRWTTEAWHDTYFAVAFEDPTPSITGAVGISVVPDLVARLRWKPSASAPGFIKGGHVQMALLLRQISGEPVPNQPLSVFGFGGNVSGRLPAPGQDRDHILFSLIGGLGVGRYISDLSSEGGQDAVYDSLRNELDPLHALSGYVGYEHWWTDQIRSTVTYGAVGVDNLSIQVPESYHLTHRATVNLVCSPIRRLDLVAEFLWGTRENKDGGRGSSSQLQLGSRLIY